MRVDDWQTRFWARIAATRETPFTWGTHDCVMFATSCIDAILGTDYYAQAKVRYPYATEAEATQLMKQFDGITGLVRSFLGEPVNWGQLGMGDVVLVGPIAKVSRTDALCVHDGAQLIAASFHGVARAPLQYAIHGWRIK